MPQLPFIPVPPAPKFPHAFPFRENCDPNNPYQAFLWMLVALPNMPGGQLLMGSDYLQLISQRLWLLGARPAEPPTLKYRPPQGRDGWWRGIPGDWVPIDAPDPPEWGGAP